MSTGDVTLPRESLRHAATLVDVSPPSIAGAKAYLGLRDIEQGDEERLTDALRDHAEEASHPDELIQTACHWLFTRRILIPGPPPAGLGP